MTRRNLFFLLALVGSSLLATSVRAQPPSVATAQSTPLGIGGRLMVTYEQDGPNGTALAVNVLPLLLEIETHSGFGVLLNAIVNAQVAGDATGLAHVGGGLTLPVYLGHERPAPGTGYYVGPHCTTVYNLLSEAAELTVAVEGGARWMLTDRLALSLALQAGVTYFTVSATGKRWVFHPGVFPALSYFF